VGGGTSAELHSRRGRGRSARKDMLPSHLSMRHVHSRNLPPELGADVRLSEMLVECIVMEFTHEGDTVFDPFAGFGTVLLVSERLGRTGYGFELDPRRAEFARAGLRWPERLVVGDARALVSTTPRARLCLSSPPYMCESDQRDPLTNYAEAGSGYDRYLEQVCELYREVARRLAPSGHLVIEVANLKKGDHVTTLAWDLAKRLGTSLPFLGETVIAWDHYGYGYDHSYCLTFKRSSCSTIEPAKRRADREQRQSAHGRKSNARDPRPGNAGAVRNFRPGPRRPH
jgi:SAM-dependent methyltransferase